MLRTVWRISKGVASPVLLIRLGGVWIFYYTTMAFWGSGEAFAGFMDKLAKDPLHQIFFALFLISLWGVLLRKAAAYLGKGAKTGMLALVMPLGVALFLTGFFLSAALRHYEVILAGEGERLGPKWAATPLLISEIPPMLRDEALESDTESLVFQYAPSVRVESNGETYEIGPFPPTYIDGTFYHVRDFGLAPKVNFSMSGSVLIEGYMPLQILPPGVVASFELPPYPYRYELSIAPEKILQKEGRKLKVYNLKDLRYNLRVSNRQENVFSEEGIKKAYFDGFTLKFNKPDYWVYLEASKDPGLLLQYTGVLVTALGVLCLPLFIAVLLFRKDSAGRDE